MSTTPPRRALEPSVAAVSEDLSAEPCRPCRATEDLGGVDASSRLTAMALVGAAGVALAGRAQRAAAAVPGGGVVIHPSPGAAAAATAARSSVFGAVGVLSEPDAFNHVLRRATFGARPSDRAEIARLGIDGWLNAQLRHESLPDPRGDAAAANYNLQGTTIREVVTSLPRYDWSSQYDTVKSALARRLFSSRQLFEVMVDVMGNHLNVPVPSDLAWSSAADYHATVLRPHALGRYSAMLKAAMRHPAILGYFGNDVSLREGLNENLGREVLELHTVGLRAGYTETDVLNSARILSGRSVNGGQLTFEYKPRNHWVGSVKVLGFQSDNADAAAGLDVGDQYLDYLANLPATARMVARKIAVRLVSDAPSQALVDALAQVYLDSDTRLDSVVWAVFCSSEFWESVGTKVRRPGEDVVGTFRALDLGGPSSSLEATREVYWRLQLLGDEPFGSSSQRGYPDTADAWMSLSGFVELWTVHRGLTAGWWPGLAPASGLFDPRPAETVGAWVDRLGLRFLGLRPADEARAALIEFIGAPESAVALASGQAFKGHLVAALMFDSPLFRTR